ncbi:sec-independent protein translocase protein TatC [Bacillus mesophilus]|uniref:Sec-independent protein translocase protein TatC n=1 Tax=Bacillus mesophilus TaxID=1808955 RepID=A0A6M0QB41_9BACI|nr:twin-arginine translocase subunit TatC [Bacillus mesophilus]MBM7662934.1 sec-independent protein translocase protein TatC [Bacillus mesophilus]NEY73523.1 twin-arginine translocase subunit TatC [Bacillus mesophilus]
MQKIQMNFVEHLEELRKRLIITVLAFLISFMISFIFVQDIYQFLVKDLDGKLALLGPGDILWVYMVLAGISGIAITIPVLAYQTWRFVSPALTKNEQRVSLAFIPGLFLLFLTGISFGYFVLFPIVFSFLQSLAGDQFQAFFTVDRYFKFMINLTLPFGFLFEMPAVVMFLTKLGIINPIRLMKARKLSYFVLIVVSVLITPPDLISDILVILPLLLLYEISISLSKFVYKKNISASSMAA